MLTEHDRECPICLRPMAWKGLPEPICRHCNPQKEKPHALDFCPPREKAAASTDCRSDEGITVGLIDTIINSARILASRKLANPAVMEALKDLADDKDVKLLLIVAANASASR